LEQDASANKESMNLVHALLARSGVPEAAAVAFRKAYPDAPPHMIEAAVHHVYVDGIGAVLDWVAAAERFLRAPSAGFDYGATSHAIYHLYNWQQLEAHLPIGRAGVLEQLADLKLFLSEGSTDAATGVVKRLEELFRGEVQPPRAV
jgi:hypothetical protein